uniref:CHC2 zinc finger domain-containing protein n=1 Tax=uncultured Methanomethylovorans sp. TaxID=183759 RepID=UPI002601DFE4
VLIRQINKLSTMEISEIKLRLSILKVLNHYHLKPDRNNRLCCPFHEDKTPSFQVYPETGTWTCFSSNCSAGSGDQVDFIMKKEGITKHEAILKAQELIGETRDPSQRNVKPAPEKKLVPELTSDQRTKILTEAFTHFARSLNKRPENAIKYLECRRLDYKKLSIGFDAGTLHKIKETTTDQKQLYHRAGLLKPDKFGREESYYTRFKGCIVFPLLDRSKNIVSMYGRHTEKQEHHYLEGDHRGLYPGYPDAETTRLILTEAVIDAATLQQLPELTKDFSILALYGTNGFTEEHRKAIAELKDLKEVILFFDGDEAGIAATKHIAGELKQISEKLLITVVDTPEGEDINSLAQGHESEIFTHLIENRKPFFLSIENPSVENKKAQGSTSINLPEPQSKGSLKVNPDCLIYETETLLITLWGGIEIHTVNRLRVTLHIKLKANEYASFLDTADLYSNGQSDRLIKQAAEKLEISSTIVSEAITGLTRELEIYRMQKREEKRKSEEVKEKQGKDLFGQVQMQAAKEFLNSPDLTENTHKLFGSLGLIGEQDSATLLFFIFLTRFFKNPLHAIVMGSTGSGKTYLLQGVSGTVPRQHIHVTTSLSENTLYYTPRDFLKHKILLQEDLDGAYSALLPLRELMSNQEISRFSTKTNSRTGDSKQVYLHVEGPVCVAGATTRDKIYEDNANRSFLIQVEENPSHERQVLEYQGRLAAGLVNFKRYDENINVLKACQLLIEPIEVIIPFAPKLELPPHVFKKMRTKNHYLTLIKSITLWNQHQRKRVTDHDGNSFLLSTLEDVEWANYLSRDVLLRKSDELSGKTRQFFESLKEYIKELKSKSFYAKDIRRHFRMHPMELQRRLNDIEARGLIRCVSRSNKPGNEYEIMIWNDYDELRSGIDIMGEILGKLKNENNKEPSQNLHTTFTSTDVKVETSIR